jgi:hypothetical protein
VQQQIRQESKALRDYSGQLQKNQYDAGTRKSMQWESYNARNSNNSK